MSSNFESTPPITTTTNTYAVPTDFTTTTTSTDNHHHSQYSLGGQTTFDSEAERAFESAERAIEAANARARHDADKATFDADRVQFGSTGTGATAGDSADYAAGRTRDNANYAADRVGDNAQYAADRTRDNANYAADRVSDNANYAANRASETAHTAVDRTADLADRTKDNANYAADRTKANANYAAEQVGQATNNAVEGAKDATNRASANINAGANKASQATKDAGNRASEVAKNAQVKASQTADAAASGIRQRVRRLSVELDKAGQHPAVQNAKGVANKNVAHFREYLGRSQVVRDIEARTNVDRVVLVAGSVLAYLTLIPLNLFGLALPTTQLLTILPATYFAAQVLDSPNTTVNDQEVKSLLSFFVVLGGLQTLESLMAGFLEKRIPQYYTVKLLFLAYLLHPKTQGAIKIHENVFRPLFKSASSPASTNNPFRGASGAAGTPPTSKPSHSAVSSPTQPPVPQAYAVLVPLPGDVSADVNLTKADARGQGFSVVSELH
ncbi:hypothetical protein CI109_106541 [Kwoniella shandongensis]|uniref:Uncharacterized protein n=1 Tax=Kwoniella shandongensis TaxID=1734106 RepID=A0A5M6C1S4_9TREE|nr:uncharacterized protein CI109_002721 [Kwoniella shandongensis]KAA5528964.1 hypothetical protein CI109_002721 [Kwoniella shandongensis]